jgi:hypothetical protein
MAFRRFVAAYDIHGDQAHGPTANALFRFTRDFNPHDRIVGGDIWDMRPFRAKASTEEKRESVTADFDAGYEFIEQWRPSHVILGNHDIRLWRHAAPLNGPVSDLARIMVGRVDGLLGRLRSVRRPYHKRDGVLTLGKLNFLHGFYGGEGACKKMASIYGPCIFGHIHSSSKFNSPSYVGRREAWSSPSICKTDMEYNEATPSTLGYSNGWMYGVYDDKSYHVQTAEVIDGRVTVATGLKSFAA